MTLLETIKKAEEKRVAVGHFNISNFEQFKAVTRVARRLDLPVVIGTSEGEGEYLDIHQAADLVKSYNREHGTDNHRIFLNADHTHSLEKVKEAAEAGYDSIVFDASKLPLEENIKQTKEAGEVAKKINPEIIMEGELGYIGGASEVRHEMPKGAAIKPEDLTNSEEAARFVKETDVQMLAPAVGNIHGMLARRSPRLAEASGEAQVGEGGFAYYDTPLNIERIKEIKKAVKIPLVLHGASGNTNEELLQAIDAGVSLIHISTELRAAWRKGLEESLKDNPDEVAPYKISPEVILEMEKVVEKRLKLFNKL